MSYNYFEPPSYEIIQGRSLIKRNNELTIDLDIIRVNKLTILHHICIPEEIMEAIPPIQTIPYIKGLSSPSPKKADSTSICTSCAPQ
jgi:hypothetical protein